MRISEIQRTIIKETVTETFGPDSRVYLFGSRVYDAKRGGDIDLLVECSHNDDKIFERKIKALTRIHRKIGERKIDLIVTSAVLEDTRLVVKEACKDGILL
jgi:uncharacterized protein